MAIDLEKLNIVIEGEATKATGAIDTLLIKLGRLRWAFSRLSESANGFSSAFGNVSDKVNSVTGSFEDVTDALNGTTKASGGVTDAVNDIATAQNDAAKAAEEAADALEKEQREFDNLILEYYASNGFKELGSDKLKTFINIKFNSMRDAKERLNMSVADIREHYFELQRRLYRA